MLKKSFFVVFVILLLVGCAQGRTGDTQFVQTKPPLPIVLKEVKEGIQFEVSRNKELFEMNDEIFIKVKITNVTDKPIPYYIGSSTPGCESFIQIKTVSQDYNTHLVHKSSGEPSKACTDDMKSSELQPHEVLEEEAVLLPKIFLGNEVVEVPSGEYDVEVWFSKQDVEDYGSFKISFPITISSEAKSMLTSAEAEKIAKNDDKVQKWIDLHSGEAVAKIENGEYYLLIVGEWMKVGKENYQNSLDGIIEDEKGVSYKEGNWHVMYLSKLGDAPHRIETVIDAFSGKVKSVTTYER